MVVFIDVVIGEMATPVGGVTAHVCGIACKMACYIGGIGA